VVLGLTFILVTLFMPKGIVGLPAQLMALKARHWPAKPVGSTTANPAAGKDAPLAKPD
jgi:hypothetical protein